MLFIRSLSRSVIEGILSASVMLNIVGLMGATIVVIGVRSHLQAEELAHQNTKTQLEVSNSSVVRLEGELAKQNRAIAELEADAINRQAEAQAAIEAAEGRAASLLKLANRLRDYQSPADPVCVDQPTPVTPEVWSQL